MPYGILFSSNDFIGENCERIDPKVPTELMPKLRNGYAERVKEISEGRIETADNQPISELEYEQAGNVYPLDQEGKRVFDETTGKQKNVKVKIENKYSVYKCFTI